jgi:transposase
MEDAAEGAMALKDEQWRILEPLIPQPHRRSDGRGRPWRDAREVLNGILWVLRTGAPWQGMPDGYPSPATCHRRFQAWVRSGVFEKILRALAEDLRDRGELDLSECFIDATFVGAKRGALCWTHAAWEGLETHARGRPQWSSSRRRRGQCFAS